MRGVLITRILRTRDNQKILPAVRAKSAESADSLANVIRALYAQLMRIERALRVHNVRDAGGKSISEMRPVRNVCIWIRVISGTLYVIKCDDDRWKSASARYLFFYFILGIIASCHSAQRLLIHSTIYKSSTIKYVSFEVVFFLSACYFDFFHEISREYVRMLFHPIGVSLVESVNLVSNVWHVEIMM